MTNVLIEEEIRKLSERLTAAIDLLLILQERINLLEARFAEK